MPRWRTWEGNSLSSGKRREIEKKREIWCAEIGVEKKSENGELWGEIGWVQKVGTVPSEYGSSIRYCLAVQV
jgi:hypothetical protein